MIFVTGDYADAEIGCKPVFLSLIPNDADTALKTYSAKRNISNGNHHGSFLREIIALQPKVGFREGNTAVLFKIACTSGEIYGFPVYVQDTGQLVVHADDLMPAFHRKVFEGTHDVIPDRRKCAVSDTAMHGDIRLLDLNLNSLPAEAVVRTLSNRMRAVVGDNL